VNTVFLQPLDVTLTLDLKRTDISWCSIFLSSNTILVEIFSGLPIIQPFFTDAYIYKTRALLGGALYARKCFFFFHKDEAFIRHGN
jgi:uncharacterized membrane protein